MGRTRRTERQAPVGYDRFGYAFCCRTVPPRLSPLQPNAQATRGTGGPLREIRRNPEGEFSAGLDNPAHTLVYGGITGRGVN